MPDTMSTAAAAIALAASADVPPLSPRGSVPLCSSPAGGGGGRGGRPGEGGDFAGVNGGGGARGDGGGGDDVIWTISTRGISTTEIASCTWTFGVGSE